MKVYLFIFVLFAYGQVVNKHFRTTKFTVADIKSIEKNFKSKPFKLTPKIYVSDDFFPGASTYELEQPIIYIRKDESFHFDEEVKYYPSSDDTIRLITHQWDNKAVSRNLKKDELLSLRNESIEKWNTKFNNVANQLTSEMGEPVEGTGELEPKSESGYGEWKERNLKWINNNSTTELKMVWTEQKMQQSDGGMLIPTFRIRTKTYWAKK